MARGKRLDPQQRAAVKAHLATGDTAAHTARATGTPLSTVYHVLAEVRREFAQTQTRADHEAAPWDYTNLVMDYVAALLMALTAQLQVLGDPDWVRHQPAGELAVLRGVLNDKAVRLLATLRHSDDGPAPDAGASTGSNGHHTPAAVEAPARPGG